MRRVLFACLCLLVAAACRGASRPRQRVDRRRRGNGRVRRRSISADGRFVVFDSAATNLVAGDTNVCVRHLPARSRHRRRRHLRRGRARSRRPGSASAPAPRRRQAAASYLPVITPDGRYVVFVSIATNLVARALPSAPARSTGSIARPARSSASATDARVPATSDGRISANGDVVRSTRTANSTASTIRQISASQVSSVPRTLRAGRRPRRWRAITAVDLGRRQSGRLLSAISGSASLPPQDRRAYVFDRASGVTTLVAGDAPVSADHLRPRTAVGLRFDERASSGGSSRPAPTARHSRSGRVDPLVGRFSRCRPAAATDLSRRAPHRLHARCVDVAPGRCGPVGVQRRRPLAGVTSTSSALVGGRHQRRRRRVRHRSAGSPRRRRRHDGRSLGDAVRRHRSRPRIRTPTARPTPRRRTPARTRTARCGGSWRKARPARSSTPRSPWPTPARRWPRRRC